MSEAVTLTQEQKTLLRPGTRIWGALPYAGESECGYANKLRYYLVAGCTKDGVFVFDITSDKTGKEGGADYSKVKANFFIGRLPTANDPNRLMNITLDAMMMQTELGQARLEGIKNYAQSMNNSCCPGIAPFTKAVWVKCDSLRFVPASLYNVHAMEIAGSAHLDSDVLDQIFYKTAIGFIENTWKNKSGMTLDTAPKSVQKQAKQYKADQIRAAELKEKFKSGKQMSFTDYQAMENLSQIVDLYHTIPAVAPVDPTVNPHVLELLGGMIDNPEQTLE